VGALAGDVSIPGWPARRLTHVLLGTCGWPGLIERLATPTLSQTMTDVDVAAAVAATRDARLLYPELLAGAQALRRAS